MGPAGAYGWVPLALMAGLFFVIGFVTWLNGPLISFVRVAFHLTDLNAFLVPMVFYLSYLLFSLPASAVARRTGLKRGLALALVVMAAGVAIFAQFIAWQSYPGALAGLLVLGAGLALLQVAINPYVSLLGPPERAAQRIAIMGVCNKFAGMVAPIVLGLLVMRDVGGVAARLAATPDPETHRAILDGFTRALHAPYLGMAILLVIAAVVVLRSSLPDLEVETVNARLSGAAIPARLWPGIAVMFLYVGVEVMAGDAIGTYGQGFGLPLDQTKFFTALTLGAMLAGYLLGLVVTPRFLSQERYMEVCCGLGAVLSVLAWAASGYVAVLLVALLGFANAMIIPALFPMAIRGAGDRTALASSLLVMAFCGGAVMPQLFVALTPLCGFQAAFTLLVLPSYLAIMIYGFVLRRQGDTQVPAADTAAQAML